MIKPPFTALSDKQGSVWIEDANGKSICDLNPFLDSHQETVEVAELLANAANLYLSGEIQRLLAKEQTQIAAGKQYGHLGASHGHKGGRPKSKHPTKASLIKRKSKPKLKP